MELRDIILFVIVIYHISSFLNASSSSIEEGKNECPYVASKEDHERFIHFDTNSNGPCPKYIEKKGNIKARDYDLNGSNGHHCWDKNFNGKCDPEEMNDLRGRGFLECNIDSCIPEIKNGHNGHNGYHCWDRNFNGKCDPEEMNDLRGRGFLECNIDSCIPEVKDGYDGYDGYHCWDWNMNRICDPEETNFDKGLQKRVCNPVSCRVGFKCWDNNWNGKCDKEEAALLDLLKLEYICNEETCK